MKKSPHDIEYLTSAFLCDGLTAQESAELQQLLKEPVHKTYFRKMYAIWYAADKAVREEDINRALQKASFRIRESRNVPRLDVSFSFRNMAAAVCIAFILGAAFYHLVNRNEPSGVPSGELVAADSKVTVPMGSKSSVELPDGTVVTLNAGSRLHYNTTYGNQSREVFLEGEGYFKVAKNEKIPFLVHARDIIVKAVGTEFNVKAYSEEQMVQTTLVNGAVSVRRSNAGTDNEEIQLKPKQTVTMFEPAGTAASDETDMDRQSANNMSKPAFVNNVKPADAVLEENINTELYTSWKDKRWVIESESLESLAKMLERRYDVEIVIADESLKQYPFSGIIADETLEQMLVIMKTVAPIDYTINKKTVRWTINPYQRKIFEKSMK